ncbi:MAG: putative membrane protein [Halioglobus sp.]|jgi:uncharacterized membrane protein
MTLLILGILLFVVVHFVPALVPALKNSWYERLGEGGYKGTFSVLLLASFALIIIGWRSAEPSFVYQPPAALQHFALVLMACGFLIMAASSVNSRLRQIFRHPQLMGVAVWGLSHLLLNGDSRSVLLFSSMALWAVVEMFAISKRDGAWNKDDIPSWGAEFKTVILASITVAAFVFAHPWLSGVAVTW